MISTPYYLIPECIADAWINWIKANEPEVLNAPPDRALCASGMALMNTIIEQQAARVFDAGQWSRTANGERLEVIDRTKVAQMPHGQYRRLLVLEDRFTPLEVNLQRVLNAGPPASAGSWTPEAVRDLITHLNLAKDHSTEDLPDSSGEPTNPTTTNKEGNDNDSPR